MARPKKYNAEYFSHDADMRNDVRIKAIRRKFKLTGYAIWCCMLEVLTDSNYFEVEWTKISIELLSADFDVEPEELTEVIEYCVTLGLLQIGGGVLYSENHQKRFDTLISKRNRPAKRVTDGENPTQNELPAETPQNELPTAKTPQNELSTAETPQNELSTAETPQNKVIDGDNPHSIVEYSKGEYSRVKDIIYPPIIPPLGSDDALSGDVDGVDPNNQDDPAQESKAITTHNPDPDQQEQNEPPPPKSWKEDFEVYKAELRQAYLSAIHDDVWIKRRQVFHPNLDIVLSLDKACIDFWSTEEGWQHKKQEHRKKNKGSNPNWRHTFNTALTLKSNQVFKPRYPQQQDGKHEVYQL